VFAVTTKFPLIELFLEKYIKKVINKLVGNNEIEDALKRLDRLTQEEARMASAELLKITNAINGEVREITGNVLAVDDKLVEAIDGTQYIFYLDSII
jgi:hypothetical protein